jgi:hypothetical protein
MDVMSNALNGIKEDATKIRKDLQCLIRSSRMDRDAQENNDEQSQSGYE